MIMNRSGATRFWRGIGTTYLLAHRYLYNQRVEDSTRQTISNVRSAVVTLSQLEALIRDHLVGE
jgi:hypothetical protein